MWFAIIEALFGLINQITKYAHDKQLIDAGQSKALADMHVKASERVAKALEAREAMERAINSDGGVRLRDWDQDRRG